jgi:hypothetical protein
MAMRKNHDKSPPTSTEKARRGRASCAEMGPSAPAATRSRSSRRMVSMRPRSSQHSSSSRSITRIFPSRPSAAGVSTIRSANTVVSSLIVGMRGSSPSISVMRSHYAHSMPWRATSASNQCDRSQLSLDQVSPWFGLSYLPPRRMPDERRRLMSDWASFAGNHVAALEDHRNQVRNRGLDDVDNIIAFFTSA